MKKFDINNFGNDEALGLGVFFGLAVTGAALPSAVASGLLATGVVYVGTTLKNKIKPPSPDS